MATGDMYDLAVELDSGEVVSVKVEDVGSIELINIASRAPDKWGAKELDEPIPLDDEGSNFIVDTVLEYTDITRGDLDEMSSNKTSTVCAAVFEELFQDDDGPPSKGRLRKVVATPNFIDAVFTEDIGVVCGMPDDATFVDFRERVSRGEVEFIFESSEWDEVGAKESIPTIDVVAVGRDAA